MSKEFVRVSVKDALKIYKLLVHVETHELHFDDDRQRLYFKWAFEDEKQLLARLLRERGVSLDLKRPSDLDNGTPSIETTHVSGQEGCRVRDSSYSDSLFIQALQQDI